MEPLKRCDPREVENLRWEMGRAWDWVVRNYPFGVRAPPAVDRRFGTATEEEIIRKQMEGKVARTYYRGTR